MSCCDAEHFYTSMKFLRGNVYTPCEPPGVKLAPHPIAFVAWLELKRLWLAEYAHKIEYQPWTPQNVADGVYRVQRSKEEKDVMNRKVPCVVGESSLGENRTQTNHREVVIVFCRINETETRTRQTKVQYCIACRVRTRNTGPVYPRRAYTGSKRRHFLPRICRVGG